MKFDESMSEVERGTEYGSFGNYMANSDGIVTDRADSEECRSYYHKRPHNRQCVSSVLIIQHLRHSLFIGNHLSTVSWMGRAQHDSRRL